MLTREKLDAAQDLKTAVVHVPEWDDDVTVRMMTGRERHTLVTEANKSGVFDMGVYTAMLVTLTMVDEKGVRLYMDDEVAIVAGKSATALQRVFEASAVLNKLTAGALDEAEKNSEPTQNVSSS